MGVRVARRTVRSWVSVTTGRAVVEKSGDELFPIENWVVEARFDEVEPAGPLEEPAGTPATFGEPKDVQRANAGVVEIAGSGDDLSGHNAHEASSASKRSSASVSVPPSSVSSIARS